MEEKTITISKSNKRRKPASYSREVKVFTDNTPIYFKQVVEKVKVTYKVGGKLLTTLKSVTSHIPA